MIKLENVTKKYDDFIAVKNLNLTVKAGEICVLLGPSGCGKSTTLRMINRLIEATSGNIYVNNKNVYEYAPEKLRQSIGYVVQSTGLFPHMTVMKNIAIVPELLGWDKKKTSIRIKELLYMVGLDEKVYADKYPCELSGGEAQRVGVARALAADPPIILMDEPFGAVDPLNRKKLQEAFLDIQKTLHKTIVFVTHDVEEAIYMGDKIAIMNNGHLETYSSPEHLLHNNNNYFVEEFLGQEYSLKMLSKFNLKNISKPNKTNAKYVLNESSTLKNTLSFMVEHSITEVNVSNNNGIIKGTVNLQDIIMIMQHRGKKHE